VHVSRLSYLVSQSIVSFVAGKTAKYDGKKLVFMNIGSWRSDC
jgi:hypothetical protein